MIDILNSSPTYNPFSTGQYMLDALGKHGTVTKYGTATTTPGSQWDYEGRGTLYMPTGSGYQVGSSYPSTLWIDNGLDFEIKGNFYLTDQGLKVPFGNLNDTAGYGHFWLVFNDQTNWGVALYGRPTTGGGTAKYSWYQNAKFPINRWVKLHVKRVAGVISCSMDKVQHATTYSYAGGFNHHSDPLVLGMARGGSYSLNGYLNNFEFNVGTLTP